jgi:hypothetical protein
MATALPFKGGTKMMKKLAGPALVLLLLLPGVVGAQYVVSPSVMAGGGARLSGGSYVVTGTTGQSSPVTVSSGGAYVTGPGFWQAAGGGALSPLVLAIELLNATTARLSWNTVAGATHYDLYRSTNAYLGTGGTAWQTVAAPTTQRNFTSGIGNPSTNYYFRGIARNASQVSPASNTVGEFDFGISTAVAKVAGGQGSGGAEERR